MKVDKYILNTLNKQTIINLIRSSPGIHRAELSRASGLSMPSVMRITDEFIRKGLVRDLGKGESSGGKPPNLLEFIPDCRYAAGIDVGTTNISAILMDLSARIVRKHIIPTDVKEGPGKVIGRVLETMGRVLDNSGVERKKILGIGIGMPGLIDPKRGTVRFSPDFGWEDADVAGPVEKRFGLPVIIDNVTRSMAMAERWFGAGRDVDNFMCINLGYGIGAAVVIDGELYKGNSGSSGEFGHITMERNGPRCSCGNRGCLEALSSGNAIAERAKEIAAADAASLMLKLAGGDRDAVDARVVFDAARSGDPAALKIAGEAMDYLGTAIAGIINFLDPKVIILEGGVTKAGDVLSRGVSEAIGRRRMKRAGEDTTIVISRMGDDAAAIGAASFHLKTFIERGGETPAKAVRRVRA
jgi:glucokinase-like ROK family protein